MKSGTNPTCETPTQTKWTLECLKERQKEWADLLNQRKRPKEHSEARKWLLRNYPLDAKPPDKRLFAYMSTRYTGRMIFWHTTGNGVPCVGFAKPYIETARFWDFDQKPFYPWYCQSKFYVYYEEHDLFAQGFEKLYQIHRDGLEEKYNRVVVHEVIRNSPKNQSSHRFRFFVALYNGYYMYRVQLWIDRINKATFQREFVPTKTEFSWRVRYMPSVILAVKRMCRDFPKIYEDYANSKKEDPSLYTSLCGAPEQLLEEKAVLVDVEQMEAEDDD